MLPYWSSLIEPLLTALEPRRILETGCGAGETTRRLLDYCIRNEGELEAIEADTTTRVGGWDASAMAGLNLHLVPSSDVIGTLAAVDLALLDGDSNYATVLADTRALCAAAEAEGKRLPVILVARVGWPLARWDRYSDPQRLAADQKNPMTKGGLWMRFQAIRAEGGYGPNQWYADIEGGEKNGVRTALDTLLEEQPGLAAIWIPGHEGMGVIYPVELPNTNPAFASWLQAWSLPAGVRKLLDSMEMERLRLATQLIDHTIHFHRLDRARQAQIQSLEGQLGNHQNSMTAIDGVVDQMKKLITAVKASTPQKLNLGPLPPAEKPSMELMKASPDEVKQVNGSVDAAAMATAVPAAPAV